MAQAVADAVGATKRQVQLWTDAKVIKCVGPVRPGVRGHQRIYAEDELPFAAIARYLADYQVPIDSLKQLTDFVRQEMAGRNAKWCVAAWRGEIESCILYRAHGSQFVWGEPLQSRDEQGRLVKQGILNMVPMTDAALVLNVHKIMRSIRS